MAIEMEDGQPRDLGRNGHGEVDQRQPMSPVGARAREVTHSSKDAALDGSVDSDLAQPLDVRSTAPIPFTPRASTINS